jgi:hypothetical protein
MYNGSSLHLQLFLGHKLKLQGSDQLETIPTKVFMISITGF